MASFQYAPPSKSRAAAKAPPGPKASSTAARPARQPSSVPSAPSPVLLGATDDPLEREARAAAGSAPAGGGGFLRGGGGPAGTAHPAPDGASADLRALRGGGLPLAPAERAGFARRFGHDFSQVRVHAGPRADGVAQQFRARALTFGNEVVLSSAAASGGPGQQSLLAHELAHVVQQQAAAGAAWVQREPAAGAPAPLKAGDSLAVQVYGLPTDATPEPGYSRSYRLDASGAILIEDRQNTVTIVLAGLSPRDAAQRIADQLVQAELFRGPRVCVTGPGMTAPACADAKTAMSPSVATAYANFMAYLRTTKEPAEAVARYYEWVNAHRDQPDFTTVTPPDLWAQSLRPPERPKDPEAERAELWIRFMKDRQDESARLSGAERSRAVQALLKFQDWYDSHRAEPGFAKADPAKVYADISVGLLKQDIEAASRKKLQDDRRARESSPEALQARSAKFDEFLALGMQLWGYSSRTFPYLIPLNSQGKDILVTGDAAVQQVLNALADELMGWATRHMSDANYATVAPKQVLLELLQGGFSVKLAEAQREPRQHETFDRNEILPGTALAAFGQTVAEGLFLVAVVGLFVGAEVLTVGQATWLLVGLAAYGGVSSYQSRRDEIERSGYDVPVPETMLDSVGDAVGVSQLIEGMSGVQLGTGMPMGSEARSAQLGSGAGGAVTLLLGSRAFRAGQARGQAARLRGPGLKPPGPNANVRLPEAPVRPAAPQPNPAMGPVETAARNALPENLRSGLDLWSAELRQNGGNPENVFGRLKPERLRAQAEVFLDRYRVADAAADTAARQAARAGDDPLRPVLRNVRPAAPGSRVTLHFENKPPGAHEIAQAIEIAARTGEEVHLFGDTVNGIDYPGIDGTIGNPPRPLSLKAAVPEANANLARKMASDAMRAARDSGYTHVEVHIEMPGRSIAQIKAAWDAPPPLPTDPLPGPALEGDVIAKVVVRAADGEWVLRPPLSGPALTGVAPLPAQPAREKEKR